MLATFIVAKIQITDNTMAKKMFNFFTKLSLQKPFCTKTSQIIEASDRVFFFQKQMSEKT